MEEFLWGNRGDVPLPGSPTITGMPARLAVMPKVAATMSVATMVAPATAKSGRSKPMAWRRHAIAAAVGLTAVLLLAGIWMRGQSSSPGFTATHASTGVTTPAPAVTASAPAVAASAAPAEPARAGTAIEASTSTAAARPAPARETPARATATAGQGVVAFAVAPWGSVFVDGDSRGTTPPLAQLTLPAGRHTIEIRNGGQAPYVAQVDVTPERPQQIRHRFE